MQWRSLGERGLRTFQHRWVCRIVGPLSVAALVVGVSLPSWPLCLAGFLGAAGVLLRWVRHVRSRGGELATEPEAALPVPAATDDAASLVEQLIAQQRYALLLRPQIAPSLSDYELARTHAELEKKMGLVPAGQVVVGVVDEMLEEGRIDAEAVRAYRARLVEVEPMLLDRYLVTNAQYHAFVADGGYQDMSLWDESIWAAVLEFVDQSGEPGPRYWQDGRCAAGEENLPVVGVSWYEAVAYARWAGKRLPTDAEWVKAACWPVSPRPGIWIERRYPWGDAFDPQKANLWCSGEGRPVPVDRYESGISVSGIHQLIGNVWEWTADNFGSAEDRELMLSVPMKSLRGGAFDTYFESQATCHFQSGENPLNRKPNIGFRLALSACDLASLAPPPGGEQAEPEEIRA